MSRSTRPIVAGFATILKEYKKLGLDNSSVLKLKTTVLEKIERLKQEVERNQHSRKPSVSVEQRFIKSKDYDRANSRITYRPSTGECFIKIARNVLEYKRSKLLELGNLVIQTIPDEVKLTLRGVVKWSDTRQCFYVTLSENNGTTCKVRVGYED